MASDNPINPRALPDGAARRRLQGRRSFSRPSSAAHLPSSGSRTSKHDASEQPEGSKRGKKPFDFNEEVDRGILRIYNATSTPLDTMAEAVKDAGGPRKLWLRKRLTQITGTRYMDMFRLDKESAAKRKERQIAAMGPTSDASNTVQSRQADVSLGSAASNRNSWTARLETASTDETSVIHDRPASLREQAVIWKPRRPSAYSIGTENDSKQQSERRPSLARLSTGSKSLVGRTPTAPTPSKRRWTDAINEETETSYGARREQTRRLSLPAIIQGLENMTGNTGLFHHINRISVQSHLSPRMPSSRFSWVSKTRSIAGGNMHSPDSPTSNLDGPIPYRPDPDYENFYHDPQPDLLARMRSEGLVAMVALMEAKAASMTDEEAEAHLQLASEQRTDIAISHTSADERGVTALHIAAAYGYPRACRYLMGPGSGPFSSIYTKRGSSVCRFARPAQDFVKQDNSLYHRILYCRQWICVGRKPPVAEETPVSARAKELDDVPATVSRIFSMDGGGILPTLPEIPNDAPGEDYWDMAPLSPASTRPHSILAPLNTDTNTFEIRRSMLEVPIEQEIFSHNGSPISVRICREDHNSLLTPNSFSPDVVFWPDGSGPAFPMAQPLPMSNQPTSEPVSIPSDAGLYPSEGLNILSDASMNGHPTPSTSLGTQYDQDQLFGTGMTSNLGRTNSYEWTATNNEFHLPVAESGYGVSNYEYTSNQFSGDGQMPGFGYHALSQSDPSRPHYPTPPADPRQTPQSGWWQPNGDLVAATSLALEQSHFPNMLWSNPTWDPPSRNDSMFQADSRNTFQNQYGRVTDDQMFYER